MQQLIQVTQEDIDRGVRGDPCHCAVARAIERTLPGCLPDVHPAETHPVVYITWQGTRQLIRLPGQVAGFARQFDVGRLSCPFEFTLDLPDEERYWPPVRSW